MNWLFLALCSLILLSCTVTGLRTSVGVSRLRSSTLSASTSFREESFVRTDLRKSVTPVMQHGNLELPVLTEQDKEILRRGERVQKQEISGNYGEGLVVLDVKAPRDVVFKTLTMFSDYENMIPTVRKVSVLSITEKLGTEAEFSLSKFRLRVNVLHTINEVDYTLQFRLNPNRPNPVFNEAQGFWHVEAPEERPEGYSRVYLSASIVASRLLPPFMLNYASSKALPRATTWLQPFFQGGDIEWS